MTRRKLIAGNWKMNLSRGEAVALTRAVMARADGITRADVLICPAAVHLDAAASVLRGSQIALGAQNIYHEKNGAFTGEISAAMVFDLGCRYVILGHSERRHILGETDAAVNKKVHAALAGRLMPVLCVGETLEEREQGKTASVIRQQIEGSLSDVTAEQMAQVVIAYEPVWAIGTGKVALPGQAEAVHMDLRKLLSDRYNASTAGAVRILYGGSVKPDNATELLHQPNVDGALVGGASLNADQFLAIIASAV